MVAVLGIDAAWTKKEPSGVALVRKNGERWRCLRAAPSYASFCEGFLWEGAIAGGNIDVSAVLSTCGSLLRGDRLSVVAVDMPLATKPITARRVADNLVSKRYGARKCSVHSPTLERPGHTGEALHQGFTNAGFSLKVSNPPQEPALIEVYPHVALLKMMGAVERIPYKASKSGTYWGRGLSAQYRKQRLLAQWAAILGRLQQEIDGIDLPLPKAPDQLTFKQLKRYEDAIDALVCAWMGIQYLEGKSLPLGDNTAAIWVPEGT